MNREQNVKTWLNEKKYLGAVSTKNNYSSVIASSEFFFKLASLFESLYGREKEDKSAIWKTEGIIASVAWLNPKM